MGVVWRNGTTAVKVFERLRNYENERDCYLRLKDFDVSEIDGLEVPQLVRYDDDLLVVEMTIVRPPYLLDFGKAWLDLPPNYTDDEQSRWTEERQKWWGDDFRRVDRILWILREKCGIYYTDPRPGNLEASPAHVDMTD